MYIRRRTEDPRASRSLMCGFWKSLGVRQDNVVVNSGKVKVEVDGTRLSSDESSPI